MHVFICKHTFKPVLAFEVFTKWLLSHHIPHVSGFPVLDWKRQRDRPLEKGRPSAGNDRQMPSEN